MTTRVQRRSRARVVRLADVQPERVEWLWPGRVPAGMITLLDGDPALGKEHDHDRSRRARHHWRADAARNGRR